MKNTTPFTTLLIKSAFTMLFIFNYTFNNAQIIVTYAGNSVAGYSGDGGAATAAEINLTTGVGIDASGNIYISDTQNNRIRKVSTTGTISTVAGNGVAGYTGDGSAATAAEISSPHGITADASGNVYFADGSNERIREINTSGIISTFAGNGVAGYSGNSGQATLAELNTPTGVTVDASGNIYIADYGNNRIRKVNTSGVISLIAGNGVAGFSGNGGQATAAEINAAPDVYVDGSGLIYIADRGNNRVRRIGTSGVIGTYAGNGTAGYSGDGGQATASEIDNISGVREDAFGNIYLGDAMNNRVRMVAVTSNIISTIAGNGVAGYWGNNGQAATAELDNPGMMTFDSKGNLYFVDHANSCIRILYLSLNVITTVTANVSCNGGSNGSASLSVSEGTTPYTYLWTGGGTNATYTGLTAGTYTVDVTDADGITGTAAATITQPLSALSVSAATTYTAICAGSTDSLISSPTGGTAPYTYAWNPNPTLDMGCSTCRSTIAYPFGTPYTITVTDNHGCTNTASVNVTVYPFPYLTVTGPISPVCAGNSDTLITTAVGATSYIWSTGATTSKIIVSPSVSTTYTVKATNMFGCYDTAHYFLDTACHSGNGNNSSTPIRFVPATTCNMQSFSTYDSVAWFTFVPTDSNAQIEAISDFMGTPEPHVHDLTLFNSSLNTVVDEPMPDMTGAYDLRIDISHLVPGNTYYVRALRTHAHSNMPGCNPGSGDICNPTQKWSFQLCIRNFPVFVPDDSGSEAPSISQLYYDCRGQIEDMNGIPRFDVKAYTDNASPKLYCSDSAVSFVYEHADTSTTFIDTAQRVDMILTGSSLQPSRGVFKMQEDSGAGYLNYFLGSVPNGIQKVEGYSRLVYKNVYPNIDMQVYSNSVGTKVYFVCYPASGGNAAGNPANIELELKGANSVSVTGGGGLNIATELGTLSFAQGFAYTDSAGVIKPKSWHANFVAVNSNTVEFNTGTYNTNEPLIIRFDRGHVSNASGVNYNLLWSTYCGGAGDDCFNGVSQDYANNNTNATGYSASTNFPVSTGAYKGTLETTGVTEVVNAVITSFNDNNVRNWSTYFGGSQMGDQDYGRAIATDYYYHNIYITGNTCSPDFPIYTNGGFANPGGYNGAPFDAFVVELNSSGGLVWSTYFGGVGSQVGLGIAQDYFSGLYVVGGQMGEVTTSTIPTYTVAGAYNSTSGTAWIANWNSSNNIVWATDIGGNVVGPNGVDDKLYGCSFNSGDNALFVTGDVQESGFPVGGPTPILPFASGGNANAVVAKIDGTTHDIDWATYYGGNGYDRGIAIESVTNDGNVYATGETSSTNIPISSNPPYQAFQTSLGGSGVTNAFIAGFSLSSGSMIYGTYFGGNSTIYGNGICWDYGIVITGDAGSGSLPTPLYGNPWGAWDVTSVPFYYNNCFIAYFDVSYQNPNNYYPYTWGTYFGGSSEDQCFATVQQNSGDLYIVGSAASHNFPTAYSGSPIPWYQSTNNAGTGASDAFISEFDINSIISHTDNLVTKENGITVYPNPTYQDVIVQIQSEKEQDMKFVLYNLLGEPVYMNTVIEQAGVVSQEISLSLLPSGDYILQVIAGENTYHSKVTKL